MTPLDEFSAEIHRRLAADKRIPEDPIGNLVEIAREVGREWSQSDPRKMDQVLAAIKQRVRTATGEPRR